MTGGVAQRPERPSPKQSKALAQRTRGKVGHPVVPNKPWYKPFLRELARSCNVMMAAGVAGVSRQAVYQARDHDPAFMQAWKEAEADAVDALRLAVWDLALGRMAANPDAPAPIPWLLTWLLKAHDPMYRDTVRQEHTGADGQPVTIRVVYEEPKGKEESS